jgi:hypothetical protein
MKPPLAARIVLVAGTSALALGTVLAGGALGAFNKPRAITPDGTGAAHQVQATDRQGDTTFAWLADGGVRLRVLRADGSLTPVRTVEPQLRTGNSIVRLDVDDDGDGVVVWDNDGINDPTTPLYARRVTRGGRVGPLRRVIPSTHDVLDAQVAVQPHGRAVLTWWQGSAAAYSTWVRTIGVNGHLGPARRLGGANPGQPVIDMDRNGRALLAWTNSGRVYVRRVSRSGALSRIVRIYRGDSNLPYMRVTVDRDGDALVTWIREHNLDKEIWGCRVSRSMQPLGKARLLSRRGQPAVQTESDMDPQGDAIVAWHVNYYAGVFARRIGRDGTVGPIVRLGNGGLGAYPVALDSDGDGAVAWVGYRNGQMTAIRLTRVRRDGRFGRTSTVAVNGGESTRITLDATPTGRLTVAWEGLPQERAHIMVVRGR